MNADLINTSGAILLAILFLGVTLLLKFRRKWTLFTPGPTSDATALAITQQSLPSTSGTFELVPRITHQTEEDWDVEFMDLPSDKELENWMPEAESVLLKEAEHVVEEIQETINNIASSPVNPEEVFTKIKAILRQYAIFLHTEYYDAINQFVAVAVKRDTEVEFTPSEIHLLWKE